MNNQEYFSGASGVYYDPSEAFQDLVLITEVEPYELINMETMKIRKIKRYDIQTVNYSRKKTALTKNDDLIYLGEF